VLLMASGLTYALANPSANLALAHTVDPHRRALAFGLKHAGIPVSTLLAGLAVPLVIVSFGWRWAYATSALIGLVVLALVPAAGRSANSTTQAEDPRRAVVPLTRLRLIAMASGISLAILSVTSLGTYLVAAAVEVGYSESAAGLLLFGGSIASIAGRVTAGHLTDTFGGRGFIGIATMAGTGAVVFALLVLASGPIFAILVLLAFATAWGWPGLMTYAVVNANPGTIADDSAIAQAGVFFGAATGPILLGWVADKWSFDATWGVVAVALTLSAVIMTRIGRTVSAAQ
jgi:predicted MFS family arabinose efflux permease